MGKIQLKTTAFNKDNETVTWETDGELYLRVTSGHYNSYGYMVGSAGSAFTYSAKGDKGGIDVSESGVFTGNMAFIDAYALRGKTIDYFKSKYSDTQIDAFFNEYQQFVDKQNRLEDGYICNIMLYGIPVYENSIFALGASTPNESGFGSSQGNDYNNFHALTSLYTVNATGKMTHNQDFYDLFTILDFVRKTGFFEFSSIVDEMIDNDLVTIETEDAVTWYVNIDGGGSTANITMSWDNPYKESHDNASIAIRVCDKNNYGKSSFLGTYGYGDQPISKTWATLYEEGATSIEAIQKIRLFLTNTIATIAADDSLIGMAKSYVVLWFIMSYFKEGTMYNTTCCYCVIDTNGNCVEKGILPEEFDDGSKIVITHKDTDDVYEEFEDDIDQDLDMNNYGVSGLSLMTTSYVMGTSRLKQLGNFLWNTDFCDAVKRLNNNPIENIISCKVFPFTVTGGADTNVVLGNIDTKIMGNPIQQNQNFVIDVGNFKIPTYYNNWIDYESVIGIFLPMCGFFSLDTESFMGKTINVKYYIDILTGVCKAVISLNNIPVQEFGGQIGFDIPVTGQNRSQTEMEQINSMVGMGVSGKNKDIMGMLTNAEEVVSPKDYFSTVGSISPTVNMMTTHDVFIVIERPLVQYPSNYNHTYGRPCNLTLTLSKLKGFTQCANVDCSTVPCTDEEKELIKGLLESGVYA